MVALPVEIMDLIVEFSDDAKVAKALRGYISEFVFFNVSEKNVLIYGQVQGGKTQEIINVIKNTSGRKVLVIQNTLLVLRQYKERLDNNGVSFQVVTNKTKTIKEDVVILLGNKYRYKYFQALNIAKYTLIIDEADLLFPKCPLRGYRNFHVTATPYTLVKDNQYDKIITLEKKKDYYGIDSLERKYVSQDEQVHQDFFNEKEGMLLVTKYHHIYQMFRYARKLSVSYPNVPVVVLCSFKVTFLSGHMQTIGDKNINKIIDSYSNYSHVVFVASRLASRGLSYVSSDYTRHLTHQYAKVQAHATNFVQSLRILGVYTDNPQLKIYINTAFTKVLEKHTTLLELPLQ